jgi:hypothetical protein
MEIYRWSSMDSRPSYVSHLLSFFEMLKIHFCCSWLRKNSAFVRTTTIILLCGTLTLSTSSSIIEEVQDVCRMGLAMISFFYFDFRDGVKQDVRHLLFSLPSMKTMVVAFASLASSRL